MINQRFMAAGSFTVPLRIDAPYSVWSTVKPVSESGGGHIVITPQQLNPALTGDVGMLAAARYAGPVLEKTFSDGAMTIGGAGMGWWLGDDAAGDVYEAVVTMSAVTLTSALGSLLPSAITAGTITDTGATYTGSFEYDIPRDAIATLMAAVKAEYVIQPDGTMDAGTNTDLFSSVASPTVVVVRRGSGSDPLLVGVPAATVKSTESSRDYATRAVSIDWDGEGNVAEHAAQAQSPAPVGLDIHGNPMVRTRVYDTPAGDSVVVGQFLISELGEYLPINETTVSTGFWELSGGTWQVGDAFWVYDDPAFVDLTNQVRFRGDVIHPKKMRLIAASWPLVDGMGVAFRDDTGTYTDLSDWVKWEATDESVGLGSSANDLGRRPAGASTLTVREFVVRTSA